MSSSLTRPSNQPPHGSRSSGEFPPSQWSGVTRPIGVAGLSKLCLVRFEESTVGRVKDGASMLRHVAFSLRNGLLKVPHQPRPGAGQPFETIACILKVAEGVTDGFDFLQTAKPRPQQVPAGQSRVTPLR